jgi:hypothetical protein
MAISIIGSGGGAAFDQLRERLFTRTDADRNGGVSLDELRALGKDRPADGPGGIGGGAAAEAAQRIFSSRDADGNGSLNTSELRPPEGQKPPSGGFGTGGFAPTSLGALLSGQEATSDSIASAVTNDLTNVIADLLNRYRSGSNQGVQASGIIA